MGRRIPKSIKITITLGVRFHPELKMTQISMFFALPVIPQNEDICWYGVTICAHRVVYEKLIHATVGTKMCAHRSVTEYEHSHTTEGTEKV